MASIATLDTLPDLRKAFYRLTGTSADDDALMEHDEGPNGSVDFFVQHGLWDAQEHMLSFGDPDHRWLKRGALDFYDSEEGEGTRVALLPLDFLRLTQDERGALRATQGATAWGREVDAEDRFDAGGDRFFIAGNRIGLTKRARVPPGGLHILYYARHSELGDATVIEFPVAERPLIIAFAGSHFATHPAFPGDADAYAKIERNLETWKTRAVRASRRSRRPDSIRTPREGVGSHWL